MFIAVLFSGAPKQDTTQTSVDGKIRNNLWCIHTMENTATANEMSQLQFCGNDVGKLNELKLVVKQE